MLGSNVNDVLNFEPAWFWKHGTTFHFSAISLFRRNAVKTWVFIKVYEKYTLYSPESFLFTLHSTIHITQKFINCIKKCSVRPTIGLLVYLWYQPKMVNSVKKSQKKIFFKQSKTVKKTAKNWQKNNPNPPNSPIPLFTNPPIPQSP